MTMRFAHTLLTALLILGIVLPRSSAAMVELGLIDARVIVICSGGGLVTLTLDAAGNPVEVSEEIGHCVLAHADLASAPILPISFHDFSSVAYVRFVDIVQAKTPTRYRLARAPPVAA